MSEAGLGLHLQKVENGDAGGLGAGAGRGRNGDMRLERSGYRSPLPYRSVDVCEKVGGVCRVEVGGLGGVDAGAASDGDERVEVSLGGELDSGLERLVGRLDLDLVEQDGVDALGPERVEHNGDRFKPRHTGVGDDGYALRSESGDLVSDLAGDAGAELDGGGVYGEGCFEFVVGHGESSCETSIRCVPPMRENFRSNV